MMENHAVTPAKVRSWQLIAGGVLIGISIGLVAWFGIGPGKAWLPSNSRPVSPAVPAIDAPAPDFEMAALDGSSIRLSDLRGKVVVLNFWATWCGPCRLEMPLLQEFQEQNFDQLTVLAINFDESEQQVQDFISELSELSGSAFRLPVLFDPGGEVTRRYRVRGFPTTMFIDRNGMLRYQHIGILNKATLGGYLNEMGVEQ